MTDIKKYSSIEGALYMSKLACKVANAFEGSLTGKRDEPEYVEEFLKVIEKYKLNDPTKEPRQIFVEPLREAIAETKNVDLSYRSVASEMIDLKARLETMMENKKGSENLRTLMINIADAFLEYHLNQTYP